MILTGISGSAVALLAVAGAIATYFPKFAMAPVVWFR
jgi:hypothetical protein